VMNIGKLNDTKAVEGFWQAAQLDTLVLDAEHVRLGQCGTSSMRQAKRKRTQGRVWLFGTAVWRDTSTLIPSNGSRHAFGF